MVTRVQYPVSALPSLAKSEGDLNGIQWITQCETRNVRDQSGIRSMYSKSKRARQLFP